MESKTELEKIISLEKLKMKILKQQNKIKMINITKKGRKLREITKILQYMNKEIVNSSQYDNYYLQIRGKSCIIRPTLERS